MRILGWSNGFTVMANVAAPLMFKRVSRVDEVMRTKGWNLAIVDALAEELGVDRVTVYKLRNRAIQWTQRAIRPENVDAWRAQQVQLLHEAAIGAKNEGKYAEAARCIDVQAKIIGSIAPTNVSVTHNVGVSPALSVKLSGLTVTELTAIAQRRDPGAEPEVVEGELVEPVESGK